MENFNQEIGLNLQHNSDKTASVVVNTGDTPMYFDMGRIAKQTAGSVWVRWGKSVVLVTVCANSSAKEGLDFFPLTCEYIEKFYAAGRIPGGFVKRETKPSEREVLNARIIDRSIRPLFADNYFNEVQIIATVMSHDQEHDTEVMALCGASMALSISELPFSLEQGPIAGTRVARINGELVANPTISQKQQSDMNLFVSSTKDAIVMVEGDANEVSEDELVEALYFAKEQGCKIIDGINEASSKIGKEKISPDPVQENTDLKQKVEQLALSAGLESALVIKQKIQRYAQIDSVKSSVVDSLSESLSEEEFESCKGEIGKYFADFKKKTAREYIVDKKCRIDGRKYEDIRPISCELGLLPCSHGSSIFTRGETQAIASITLGSKEDEQREESLLGETSRRFMLHYNFPPFCVGEAKFLRGTSRREIGHGNLAQRAVEKAIPSEEDFPYAIRVVSEVCESNGSSSMATVCSASLALWDSGVTLNPVAGIAMGLIKEGDKIAVLSDILGDEDHLGDMDFKVCGTANGITAIQMDIKIKGLQKNILEQALSQAKQGRNHILGEMKKVIDGPAPKMKEHAPRIINFKINSAKIKDVIGPGGKIIKDIIAQTDVKINIEDNGLVKIAGVGKEKIDKARSIIEDLTREAEVGRVYQGKVIRVLDFGAFVEIFPGTEGLCHISELCNYRVAQVSDVLKEGDQVNVAVLNVDRDGKIKLSKKRAMDFNPGEMIK